MSKEYKFCSNCGEKLSAEDNFCHKCGFNFESRETSESSKHPAKTKINTRKNKQLGFIGGIILLLILVVYLFEKNAKKRQKSTSHGIIKS